MFNKPTVVLAFCITMIVRAFLYGITTIPWWVGLIFLLLVKDFHIKLQQPAVVEEDEKIEELANTLLKEADKAMEDEDGR